MGEEEGGMRPIPIIGNGKEEPEYTAEQFMTYAKQRHEQRLQWGILVVLGLVVLGLVVVPLALWLSRIALGG
jgi:hypothetical protein